MTFPVTRNAVVASVILALLFSAGLSVLSLYVDLTESFFDALGRSLALPIPRFLITFVLLSLSSLLCAVCLQWSKTARRQRESEGILASVNPDVLMLVDPDRSILTCTASVHRMFGYEVHEVINKKTDLLYLDRRGKTEHRHEIYNILEMEGFHLGAASGMRKNGEPLFLEIATSRLSGRQGALLLIRDITRHRKAEEAASRDHDFVSAVIDTAGAPIVLLNRDGQVVRANRAFENLTGLAASQTRGRRFWDLFQNPEAVRPLKAVFEKLPENNFPIDHEHLLKGKDGSRRLIAWTSTLVGNGGTPPEHIVCIGIDITEHAQREERLRESAERYRALIDHAKDAIILTETDGRLIDANRRAAGILGYSKEELSRMHLAQVSPKRDLERIMAAFREVVKTGSGVLRDASILRKDGTSVAVDVVGTVIECNGKRVVQGILRPLGESVTSDDPEDGRGVPLSAVAMPAQYALWSLDDRLKVDTINAASKRFFFFAFGVPLERGMAFMECIPPESRPLFAWLYNGAMGGDTLSSEYRYDFGGRPVDTEIRCSPIATEDGVIRGAAFSVGDVSEWKKAASDLGASLREKEALVREAYQRVKNNLQAVASLLSIRAEQIRDREALELFKDSQGHIRAVALIYEKLCQSEDPARMDFGDFVGDLIRYLYRSYRVSPTVIRHRIAVDDIRLTMDKAVSCGLLINELLSNSLRHAFPGEREGEIFVDLRMKDHAQVTLIVGDDGMGMPKDIDFRNAHSLGLQLVQTLVLQLKGSIELRSEGGTEFKVEFAL